MADNKSNRGNPDRLRISLTEEWEGTTGLKSQDRT